MIAPSGKIFAPGNLRAAGENAPYREVINKWIDSGYTLRYTGGMVPDVRNIDFCISGNSSFELYHNAFISFLDLLVIHKRLWDLYECHITLTLS